MRDKELRLYRYWLKHNRLSANEKKQLTSLSEKQKEELFQLNGSELNFGTSGIRALTGLGPKRINIHTFRVFAEAYAKFLLSKKNKKDIEPILIGYDNRENGKIFAKSVYQVLEKHKIPCLLSSFSIPTPVLAFYIKHKGYSGGMMITASHNTQEYNGFKLYGGNGGQLSQAEEREIRELFVPPEKYLEVRYNNSKFSQFGNESFELYTLMLQKEIRRKLGNFYITGNAVLRTIKFLFSSHHGTSSGRMLSLARIFGAQKFREFYWECTPTNAFPEDEVTNPEEPISFKNMEKEAKKHSIDYLIAHDPDSDRGAIAEWSGENWYYFTGNELAALLASFLLELNLSLKYNIQLKYRYLVTTYVSGDFIDKVVEIYSPREIEIRRVNTGFKSIGKEIEKCVQEGKGEVLIAFEEAIGGLYFPSLSLEKDAFQQTILSMYLISYLKFSNLKGIWRENTIIKKLYWLMWKINYAWMGKTVSFKLHDDLQKEKILKKLTALIDEKDQLKLGKFNFEVTLGEIKEIVKFNFVNSRESWIKARFSGTEPKFKLYFNLYSAIDKDKIKKNDYDKNTEKIDSNWKEIVREKRAKLNYTILTLTKLFERFFFEA